jgi:hypothetical protein
MNLSTELFVNFWTWWYYHNLLRVIYYLRENILRRMAIITGIDVHFANLFTPFYQDYSGFGRTFSFVVRVLFILYGGVIQLIALGVSTLILGAYIILPVLPLLELWSAIISQA